MRSARRSGGERSGWTRRPPDWTRFRRSRRCAGATPCRSARMAVSCAARASSSLAGACGCASWTGASIVGSRVSRWSRRAMARNAHRHAGLAARLARLDVLVAALERDDLELGQALALFEEGIQPIRHARELRRQAELRVEQLQAEEDGTVVIEPMDRGEP